MTVVMKIDLVGPKRRGLALGLSEAAGYGGVAVAAAASGWLASEFVARDVLVVAGAVIAVTALALSVLFVRDTGRHGALEEASHHPTADDAPPRVRDTKPLIVSGMLLQATALALLAASGGSVAVAAIAAVGLGAGTALVYPTLVAAISDAVSPVARAPTIGVYPFWRDSGYVAGGVIAGVAADALGYGGALAIVAALTAASDSGSPSTCHARDGKRPARPADNATSQPDYLKRAIHEHRAVDAPRSRAADIACAEDHVQASRGSEARLSLCLPEASAIRALDETLGARPKRASFGATGDAPLWRASETVRG